jgi:1-phosphatidylinositol-3-phosphate 5-kinase
VLSSAAEQGDNEVDRTHSTVSMNACIPRKWRTYQYYSQDPGQDQTLGQVVEEKCGIAEKACSNCTAPIRSHQFRWVTGRTRIIAEMHADATPADGMTMWSSCHECKAVTSRQTVAHGTW